MKAVFLLFFLALTYCKADFFSRSSRLDSTNLSDEASNMIYCNKFNQNGFQGLLTAYYDLKANVFKANRAQLYLWSVPQEFKHPPTNYIQLYTFRIENHQEIFNKTPVNMELVLSSSQQALHSITALDHSFLQEIGGSIDSLIKAYFFILDDVKGWQGVTISVFNSQNQPVKTAQALLPPFYADPNELLMKYDNEPLLFKLHPFKSIAQSPENARDFYEKGLDFCKSAPVHFALPKFKEPTNTSAVDHIIEEFSFESGSSW